MTGACYQKSVLRLERAIFFCEKRVACFKGICRNGNGLASRNASYLPSSDQVDMLESISKTNMRAALKESNMLRRFSYDFINYRGYYSCYVRNLFKLWVCNIEKQQVFLIIPISSPFKEMVMQYKLS